MRIENKTTEVDDQISSKAKVELIHAEAHQIGRFTTDSSKRVCAS